MQTQTANHPAIRRAALRIKGESAVTSLVRSNLAFYGAARDLQTYDGPEVIISGPYETGKTIGAIHRLHSDMARYPGARGLMVRKTYKSLISSAVVTYEQKVLPYPPDDPRCPIKKLGKSHPEWYDYPNGARLYLGGMDRPDKFLSAEFDRIYVNQAEEITLDDWEKLTGRATGRAGNVPYAQSIGDCNPGAPTHWIRSRERLKVFYSKHEDNPVLYDPATGEITEQGKRTMATLDALTGVRYKRGRLGLWVAAEGQVYDGYDEALHIVDRFDIPADWRRIRAVDFGFTNPFVCLWIAIDHDGRMFVYRQLYRTQRLVEDHAADIKRLSDGERIEATVTDHDAEDRATLERHGVLTTAAQKEISPGIQSVATRLRKAGDNKPRLYIMRDTLIERDKSLSEKFKPCCIEDEFPVYLWPKAMDGKPIKEIPVDENNHAMDALRYAVRYVDRGRATSSANPFFED